MSASLPLIKGTLDLLVLKALSWTPMHGFEIVTWLEQQSGAAIEVKDSALYQALFRMEERELVEAQWGATENNRKARYYHITKAGQSHLASESKVFLQYAATVRGILESGRQAPGGAS